MDYEIVGQLEEGHLQEGRLPECPLCAPSAADRFLDRLSAVSYWIETASFIGLGLVLLLMFGEIGWLVVNR